MTVRINEENFKQIDPTLLLDPTKYQDVEDMVVSIGAAATADYALVYLKVLVEKLDVLGDRINGDLLNKYLRLVRALKLFSISLVKDETKQKFFQDELLDILSLDFVEIEFWIDLVFRVYHNDPEIIESIRLSFVRGLENNPQKLGGKNLVIKGQDHPIFPGIKNWLIDYRSFSQSKPIKINRGPLEEASYVNTSPNTKQLSVEDRNILLKIIKLYDWLQFHEFKYDFSIGGQQIDDDNNLSGEDKHVLIPDELIEIVNKVRSKQVTVQRNVVANPKPIQKVSLRPPPPPPPPTTNKEPTTFEKKLAQVSTPGHGADLEALKYRVEQNQIKATPVPLSPPVKMTPTEINREVSTKELSASPTNPSSVSPNIQKPNSGLTSSPARLRQDFGGQARGEEKREVIIPKMFLRSLNDIRVVDDLKRIEVGHLRQGELQKQISDIRFQITRLAQSNHLLPYYVVLAFEQSPLFKSYLQVGSLLVHDQSNDRVIAFRNAVAQVGSNLTLQEFEAVADLRKEIERL